MTTIPTPLPLPPRRVRAIPGSTGAVWFGRLFILPHTLIGIGAAGYLLFLLLWTIVGTDIPGVVTGSDITHSSKGGTSYILKYQYQVGGQVKSGSGSVSQTVYERFQTQDLANPRITVRYFSLGPLERAALREGRKPWAEVGMLALWVAFWDSIVSVFLYELWVKPLRRRWLYKHGATAAGTVLSKRVKTGKTSSYFISYTFADPATGRPMSAETQVCNEAAWNRATVSQPITVLYAPDNPKRSTIYEFGGYYVDLALQGFGAG